MTVRTLSAQCPGPVLVAVTLPFGTVQVTTDPQVTTAELTLKATTDDPALTAAVERAELRWDPTGALVVSVPDLPAVAGGTGIHVTNLGSGMVITGTHMVFGHIAAVGGKTVINGVTVSGPGTVSVGTIEITARVPERSNLDVRGPAAEVFADGHFGDVTAKTISGDVRVLTTRTLTATTTSGDVHVGEVDGYATVHTVSGDVRIYSFIGNADLASVSGHIGVRVIGAASGNARSVSGNVKILPATVATVAITATSVSGRATTTAPTRSDGSPR